MHQQRHCAAYTPALPLSSGMALLGPAAQLAPAVQLTMNPPMVCTTPLGLPVEPEV